MKAKKGVFTADARKFGGKRKRFKEKAEAEAYLEEVRRAKRQGSAFLDPRETLQVDEAIFSFLKEQKMNVKLGLQGEGNLYNKTLAMKQFADIDYEGARVGRLRIGTIRSAQMQKIKNTFVEDCARRARSSTGLNTFVNIKWPTVIELFTHLIATDQVKANIPAALPKLRRDNTGPPRSRIAPAVVANIIEHVPRAYRLHAEFAACTGLRAGEQRALRWADLELNTERDESWVNVSRAVKKGEIIGPPKSKAGYRSVHIGPELVRDLREWRLAQPIEQRANDLVFPSDTGKVVAPDTWRNSAWEPALKASGEAHIRWHDLRHYYASVLLFDSKEEGENVARLLGHHSIAFTLATYGHWFKNNKRDEGVGARHEAALRGGRS